MGNTTLMADTARDAWITWRSVSANQNPTSAYSPAPAMPPAIGAITGIQL